MRGDIEIRDARAEDAESLATYMAALLAEDLDVVAALDPPPTAEFERTWLEGVAATAHAFVLVAVVDARVVGVLDFRPVAGRKRTSAGSFGMSVARDFRRAGIGRRLAAAMIERAQEDRADLSRIELEVVPWNTGAIRLYESLGFKLEGRKEKSVAFRGRPEALLVMARVW